MSPGTAYLVPSPTGYAEASEIRNMTERKVKIRFFIDSEIMGTILRRIRNAV
jgi:hypothetical protein